MKRRNKKPKVQQEANPSQNVADSVLQKLEAAARGLLYISETDAPLTPFFWPTESEKVSPQVIKQNAKLETTSEVSTQELDEFFEPVAIEEEWMNDEEKTEAQRFQNLQKILEENIKGIKIFRFGETNLDVFIVGKTEGGFAGVRTKVVET